MRALGVLLDGVFWLCVGASVFGIGWLVVAGLEAGGPRFLRNCGPRLREEALLHIVRLDQWSDFEGCFTGPEPGFPSCCVRFDFDKDEDLDLRDVSKWMRVSSAPVWQVK